MCFFLENDELYLALLTVIGYKRCLYCYMPLMCKSNII